MARPVIAKGMVDCARAEGADAVAHGCTGKGNDQVGLDVIYIHMHGGMAVPFAEPPMR